ncbi:hypothetical protein GJAV_G00236970 [Gymnothorax javanicus]|nr:hypothetical protein GJAV_G00236970 [Gymnothorax javanicus]
MGNSESSQQTSNDELKTHREEYERLTALAVKPKERQSADLLRRRAEFNPVKKQLHQAGVKFSLAHPATLRFSFNGVRHEFKSPENATAFVAQYVLPTATAPSSETEREGYEMWTI